MTAIHLVLEKVWRGHTLTGDDIIVLLLLLAMAASVTHLCTMLITRWGDRYIAFKSLAGSLLVHCVCFLGLEVFDPLQPDYVRASIEMYQPVEVVTEILIESDDQVAQAESGNTSAPDQPTRPQIDLERLPIPSRDVTSEEIVERDPEELDLLDLELPDATEFAERAEPQLTARTDDGLQGPPEVAAEDPGSDLEVVTEQNSADVYAAEVARSIPQVSRRNQQRVTDDRDTASGNTERIDTQLSIDEASIDLATSGSSSGVEMQVRQPDTVIRRRSAPVTGTEPTETVGTDVTLRTERSVPTRTPDRRLPRPERFRPSDSLNERPSRLPSQSPRTPTPLSSSYEDVRVGPSLPLDSSELRTAADMVDLSASHIRRTDQPAAYRLRSHEYRQDAVWKFGGTERSEATVERSLRWLARQQSPDGRWNADAYGAGLVKIDELGVDRDFAGRDADTGITALVTLAFLGAGYTHEDGRYAIQVDRALDWLIRQQNEQGSLAGGARRYARMYSHAMATYALAEALGMQKEAVLSPVIEPDLLATAPAAASVANSLLVAVAGLPTEVFGSIWSAAVQGATDTQAWSLRRVNEVELRSALLKAVRFTVRQQHVGGGWRYAKGQEGDVSMFGWQLMSLKSAEIAGVQIPGVVKDRMFRFINEARQGSSGGLFGYRYDEKVTPVMTAEALFCQQMLGFVRDTARNRESVRYLLKHRPRLSELNLYYWYYGTLAMYQYGGEPWEQWNNAVRDTLIREQVSEGEDAGSWNPRGPWGRYGGRLYATALATLTLEVYYRLLPLYQMNEDEDR